MVDVYSLLNRAGVVAVDDLCNLDQIRPEHNFVFIGFPLSIRWVVGGPARVFAVNMNEPTDFIDCSHPLDTFPQLPPEHGYPFMPPETKVALNDIGDYPNPWPGRIDPREDQGMTMRATRLSPFRFLDGAGREFGNDMYIEYGHGTGTHIEAAFFDPWGRHAVPDEILRRYVRIPKDRLVAQACLLDLSEEIGPLQQIDYTHLRRTDPGLKPGDICVMRVDITDWYFYGAAPGKTPGLSPDAAKWLVDKGIRALVVDFAVEKSDPMPSSNLIKYTPNKIHYFLHKNNIPVIEWAVNLKNLRRDRFTLAVCSMPASHQGGFPAHVFAIEKW
jgi:kynurenine formamidase